MTAITLRDGTLYFTDHAPASSLYPPLVLVHGAGGSRLDWPPGLRRLSGARVITVDLPGHGRSSASSHTDTLAYAHDIAALLETLDIERAIVVGHSMGGAIAQQFGIHHPARAAGLVLLGTGSKLPVEPSLPQRIVEETEQAIDWLMEWAWSPATPLEIKALGRERLGQTPARVLQRDYLACQAFDVRGQLERIHAPTLVIAGDIDRMVRLKFGMTLAEQIPHASLTVLEGAEHMFPLERADDMIRAIRQWLAAQEWDA